MCTAVLTCIYPWVVPFLRDFVESLSGQSRKDFTLLVLNDGVADCEGMFLGVPFPVKFISASGTPSRIRKSGIEWLSQNGFDVVVFADSDDRFAENRVAESVALLEEAVVVFNDLIFFGAGWTEEESMYGGRYFNSERLDAASILTSNSLGLTNTAAHMGVVFDASFKTSDDTIAFDWSLFTRVLAGGKTALYTSQTRTYYRQHGANIAVPGARLDRDILRGVTVKARHYEAVSDLGTRYRELARHFAKLEAKIFSDPDFAVSYCSTVRERSPKRPLWWENIRTEEELIL